MSCFTIARVAAVGALIFLLAGCTVDAPTANVSPTAANLDGVRPLGAGFLGSNPTPSPEATVSPERGSWDGVEPPAGYRVVLITAGDDAPMATVGAAVQSWAKTHSVDLEVVHARHDDDVEDQINAAVAERPDLVVGVGDKVVDVFTLLTPQHLSQRFLMIGVELPEPTENVTSVIWPGAAYRGSGVGTSGDIDVATFTPQRADEAVNAGVASVLHGLGGIVVSLPE